MSQNSRKPQGLKGTRSDSQPDSTRRRSTGEEAGEGVVSGPRSRPRFSRVLALVVAVLVVLALVWVGFRVWGGGGEGEPMAPVSEKATPEAQEGANPDGNPTPVSGEVLQPPAEDPQPGVPRELGGAGGGTESIEYTKDGYPETDDPGSADLLRNLAWGSSVDTPPLPVDFLKDYANSRGEQIPVDVETETFLLPEEYVTEGESGKKYLALSFINGHNYSMSNVAIDLDFSNKETGESVAIRNATVKGIPARYDKFLIFELSDAEFKEFSDLPRDQVEVSVKGNYSLPSGDLSFNSDSWIYPLNG